MEEKIQTNTTNPISPPPVPSDPPPIKHSPKAFIIAGILLVLCLIGIAGYQYVNHGENTNQKVVPPTNNITPSPTSNDETRNVDQITNWKIYRNEKYGFEFIYPKRYLMSRWDANKETKIFYTATINEKEGKVRLVYSPPQDMAGFTLSAITVNPKKTHDFNDLNNCKTDKVPGTNLGKLPCTSESPQKTTVAGIQAEQLDIQVADTFGELYIHTIENPLIELIYGEGGYAAPKELFDQILSTFKFIEPTSAIDTSNWKTYTNSIAGYSIRYPENWQYEDHRNSSKYLISSVLMNNWDKLHNGEIILKPTQDAFFIRVYDLPGNVSINDFFMESYSMSYRDLDDFTVNSYSAKRVIRPGQDKYDEYIFVESNGKIYEFLRVGWYGKEATRDIFSSSLSTFKLTQ